MKILIILNSENFYCRNEVLATNIINKASAIINKASLASDRWLSLSSQSPLNVLASALWLLLSSYSPLNVLASALWLSLSSHSPLNVPASALWLLLSSHSPLNVLASALWLSLSSQSPRCCHRPTRDRLATVAHLFSWRSHLARDSICSDTVTYLFGHGRTLRFPILFVVQVPARTSSSLQSRRHLLK